MFKRSPVGDMGYPQPQVLEISVQYLRLFLALLDKNMEYAGAIFLIWWSAPSAHHH